MTIFLTIIFLPLSLVNLVLSIEVIVGLVPHKTKRSRDLGRKEVVVIVPAHNEQAMIHDTLSALVAASNERGWVLVIADNCSDSTAEIARSHSVVVSERFDETRRGKGFALDHARGELRAGPPDCVVVVDADCSIDRASLDALVHKCLESGLPAQAINLLRPERGASPIVQISNFAFFLKNSVRQRGLQRLAGRVHLTGTGMAFPWHVFESARLATSSIVEDLQLGIDLAEAGYLPQLVPQAFVWSGSASDAETMVQRRRWEGGFLAKAFSSAPRVLLRAVECGDARRVWAALDLFVPPVALLVILNAFTLVVGLTITLLDFGGRPQLVMAATSFVAVVAVVMLAWIKEGLPFMSLRALASAPFYVIRKFALYGRLLLTGAPAEWQRTKRDGGRPRIPEDSPADER